MCITQFPSALSSHCLHPSIIITTPASRTIPTSLTQWSPISPTPSHSVGSLVPLTLTLNGHPFPSHPLTQWQPLCLTPSHSMVPHVPHTLSLNVHSCAAQPPLSSPEHQIMQLLLTSGHASALPWLNLSISVLPSRMAASQCGGPIPTPFPPSC